ncbi:Acylphosphatase [uncultured archaeon]|nr:Acylphosphatase [uncultured archaeon]
MKIKAKIIGNKVHEVGYRVFLLRKALELGAERFNAYNTKENGDQVLISFLEGDSDQISIFQDYVQNNKPENAKVSDVIFEDYTGYLIGIVDYMHLIQVEQLSKGIPAILSIDRKQDKMLEKQDQMLEKQDQMLEKQDQMLENQEKTLGKLDQTRTEISSEIKDLRRDLRSYLDEKLIKIESDILQIKAKIGLET